MAQVRNDSVVDTAKLVPANLTGYYPDGVPTSAGAQPHPLVIAAVSDDLRLGDLPYGTVFVVEIPPEKNPRQCGYHGHKVRQAAEGPFVVADRTDPKRHFERRVDLLLSPRDKAIAPDGKRTDIAHALGFCPGAHLRIVAHINVEDIPATRAELVAVVKDRAEDVEVADAPEAPQHK